MWRFLLAWLLLTIHLVADPAVTTLWTNQAGHAISATLTDFDGRTVTLRTAGGEEMRMPLSALSVADQRRVRVQQGISLAPAVAVAAFRDGQDVLTRYQRASRGQQDEESLHRAERMALAIFDARVTAQALAKLDADVRQAVMTLREALTVSGR